jgi:hypothetical protein
MNAKGAKIAPGGPSSSSSSAAASGPSKAAPTTKPGDDGDEGKKNETNDDDDGGSEENMYVQSEESDDSVEFVGETRPPPTEAQQKKRRLRAAGQGESKFAAMRNEMKERIIKEVMSEVMGDIGEYDIDGMVEDKSFHFKGPIVDILKFFGCWRLTLHECVVGGKLDLVEQSIARINKINPLLINQYDEQGRTALSLAVKTGKEDIVMTLLQGTVLASYTYILSILCRR